MKNYVSYAHEKGKKEGLAEGIAIGKAEGLAEGKAIGEVKGIHKTAKNMKSKGVSMEIIMECTGLSAEEIESL